MLWIFFAFLLGSAGGSLLIYYDLGHTTIGPVWGDLFALFAMGAAVPRYPALDAQ